jgi:hypothetical protein
MEKMVQRFKTTGCEPVDESSILSLLPKKQMTQQQQIDQMLVEARDARSAIRHALQFLRDPTHQGDGHLDECIAACENVLKTDGRWEPKPKCSNGEHSPIWYMGGKCTRCGNID